MLPTFSIMPTYPAVAYGYVERGDPVPGFQSAYVAKRFVEKPDLARAKRFLRSGTYLWNAGMFVWRAERFLSELAATEPAILRAVEGTLAGRARAWARASNLSTWTARPALLCRPPIRRPWLQGYRRQPRPRTAPACWN